MALGTYVYPVVVAVGEMTYPNNAYVLEPDLGDIWIDSVEIVIPPGHRGLTGIYLANSGGQLVPYGPTGTYLVGDDDRLEYSVGAEFDTGFQIVSYNEDIFQHNFYLRFSGLPMALYNQATGPAAVPILPITA